MEDWIDRIGYRDGGTTVVHLEDGEMNSATALESLAGLLALLPGPEAVAAMKS